jgi:hypothetical protein
LVIAVVGGVVLARRGGPGTELDDEHEVAGEIGVDAGSDAGPEATLEHEA